jgi:hypothetical protein
VASDEDEGFAGFDDWELSALGEEWIAGRSALIFEELRASFNEAATDRERFVFLYREAMPETKPGVDALRARMIAASAASARFAAANVLLALARYLAAHERSEKA